MRTTRVTAAESGGARKASNMRGHQTLITTSFALVLCVVAGCGDSEDTSSSHNVKGSGKASEGTAGSAALEPLPDKTAGKTCEADGDCATGMCLTSIPGSFGSAAMDAPGGYCSATCTTNTDCGEGGVCSGAFPGFGGAAATPGRCMQSCESAEDCRDGYRCVNALGMAPSGNPMDPTAALLGPNACQPTPATTKLTDGVTGKACAEDKECGQGRCAKSEMMMTYPDGYCTGACLQDADCGAGGSCTLPAIGSGAGSCYSSCQTNGDSDCRKGYRCRTNGSRRQCIPGPAPLADRAAGKQCQADADCGGTAMSCVTSLGGMPAPGGYCSISCSENADCGAEGTCVGGLGAAFVSILGNTGTCYRGCTDSSSCREGYVCGQPPSNGGGLQGMMIPGAMGGAMIPGLMMSGGATVCTVPPPPTEEDAGVP